MQKLSYASELARFKLMLKPTAASQVFVFFPLSENVNNNKQYNSKGTQYNKLCFPIK